MLVSADELSANTGISADRLIELAEAGYLPHWRVDGGPPTFVSGEAKQWIFENLMHHYDGAPLPVRFFVIIDRPPADPRMLPAALRDIKELRDITDVMFLRSGVYILCHRNRVVYVGQAAVAARRINEHFQTKDFDRVLFLPWPRWDLDQIEGALIRLLEPPLNRNENGSLLGRGDKTKDEETLRLITSAITAEMHAEQVAATTAARKTARAAHVMERNASDEPPTQ